MENTEYKIKTPAFEGPMALLMHLLEKNKVDIYDIPIAEIAAQYLEYINNMQELDMELASEFIVMASLLLHIKARMLLPQFLQPEGDADISDDPRDILVEKIIEYKKFKKYASILEKAFQAAGKYTSRTCSAINLREPVLTDYDPAVLFETIKRIMDEVKADNTVRYVDVEELSVQDSMRDILERLQAAGHKRLPFVELFDSRLIDVIIVSFLAVLELLKQGDIVVFQSERFAPIHIQLSES